ncbi:HHL309Cp [Eremothecium sinecaudum]|uniref:HHL309Cp n=1 Tax=Eremothecium sinecaudum TaxID=45286 RepID=A0A0X8HVV8_9SACH|nr:HHL309Cp [Eremothecium sinecaudum]AMD22461.1 HHL309Cp [Eremothecium sinecaudum]
MSGKPKTLIKEAKRFLELQDWSSAIETSNNVLELDPANYFAHVFLGKSYSMEKQYKESLVHYQEAINIDFNNTLAWKGLFLLLEGLKDIEAYVSYDEYFNICGQYAEVLQTEGGSQVRLIDNIKAFVASHPDSKETFLRHLRSGMTLAERLGRHFMTPKAVLEQLLKIVSDRESNEVSRLVSRERLKLSTTDPDYSFKLNTLAWQVYQSSELNALYEQLVNVVDDDNERRELEGEWLKYRLKLLKAMPNEFKLSFYEQVKEMVIGMVVVEHDSLLAWKLYFEWQDYETLNDLEMDVVSKFVRKFPTEPLAIILYAWICSTFSGYDSRKFYNLIYPDGQVDNPEASFKNEIQDLEGNSLQEYGMVSDDTMTILSESEVVDSLKNIKNAQTSILAHRIVSNYFLTLEEYEFALPIIKQGIQLVANTFRDLGLILINSKRGLSLCYATVYTYYESPKNHSTALALFDKLLQDEPDNQSAKIGKSFICIQREQWEEAHNILHEVSLKSPDDYKILSDLGWCQFHLKEHDEAKATFLLVLDNVKPIDVRTSELVSLTHWRFAKVLLEERNDLNADSTEVKQAYKHLIQAIKATEIFSPAYALLGHIYYKYFMDQQRAFKCFFRAFELNPSDVDSVRHIVGRYCETGNWKSASVICERLIKSLTGTMLSNTVGWTYRTIGIYHLEEKQEADAIEWFQSAVRIDADDVESWVGLGQAYAGCGRIEASIKVYRKALELDSQHKFASYFLARSLSQLGEFAASIDILLTLVDKYQTEEVFLVSLAEITVEYAMELYDQGCLVKSAAEAAKAIKVIENIVKNIGYQVINLWIALMKAIKIFIFSQSQLDKLPLESLFSIFEACQIKSSERVDAIDPTSLDSLVGEQVNADVSIVVCFLILAAKYAIATSDYESLTRTVRASLWCNLGIAGLLAYVTVKDPVYATYATQSFKKVIRYQSNTFEAWIGLGIASMNINYRVSQHCFIKASIINPKDPMVWFNLALLSLKNNDVDFAKDLLVQLQSAAPQDFISWFGIALALEQEGNTTESSNYFSNAFILSKGRYKPAQLFYAMVNLNNQLSSGLDERDIEPNLILSTVAYSLEQYLKKSPEDILAIQYAILTFERLRNYDTVSRLTDEISGILEKRFETTQNEQELFNYGIIKAHVARTQLGLSNYEAAIENANISLGILEEKDITEIEKTFISNHVVLGLSHCFTGNLDQALEHFKVLLATCGEQHEIVLLISKLLHNMHTSEASNIAFQELVEYNATHGSQWMVLLTMAIICLIDQRTEELPVILKELQSLPMASLINDKHNEIPFIIYELRKAIGSNSSLNQIWQRSLFYFPNSSNLWQPLSNKTSYKLNASGQNAVTAKRLSDSLIELGNQSKIQLGMFLCPWNEEAVITLKSCL